MSGTKTHEEVRQDYVSKMGAELGELFHVLSAEVTWLYWKWKQFRTLFGDKPARIAILNETAPTFFRFVQDVFFEDTVLGIARIIGPVKSVGKANLTIDRLPGFFDGQPIGHEVRSLVDRAKSLSDFAVDWRNRHLAHRDLDLSLKRAVKPLEKASREKVELALDAIIEVLNHVEREMCRSTTAYKMAPLSGDAEALLYVLRDGLRRAHDREATWSRGDVHEDDPLEAL